MITQTHLNGIKTIGLRLDSLRQQLERIVDEQDVTDDTPTHGFVLELIVDHDDLEALIAHVQETAHNIAKHLGVDYGTDDNAS